MCLHKDEHPCLTDTRVKADDRSREMTILCPLSAVSGMTGLPHSSSHSLLWARSYQETPQLSLLISVSPAAPGWCRQRPSTPTPWVWVPRVSSAWDLAFWDEEELLKTRHSWDILPSDSNLNILKWFSPAALLSCFHNQRQKLGVSQKECSPHHLFWHFDYGKSDTDFEQRDS